MPNWNDHPDQVDFALHCQACGYLLQGLASQGPCPECGTPIRESLSRRPASLLELAHVPGAQARALRVALGLIGAGVVLWMATGVMAFLLTQHAVVTLPLWAPAALAAAALGFSTVGWGSLIHVESTRRPGFVPLLTRAQGRGALWLRALTTLSAGAIVGAVMYNPGCIACLFAVAALVLFTWSFTRQYDLLRPRQARLNVRGGRPGQRAWWMLFPIGAMLLVLTSLEHAVAAWFAIVVMGVPSLIAILALYLALGETNRSPSTPGQQ